MIIYFEGLACAGKTTLVNYLKKKIINSIIVPELPRNYLDMGDSLTNNFCRTNDERKCQDSVKFQKKYDYVLVDRGYASTLIYNYIQFQSKTPNEYLTTINWYMNGITNGKLIKPDLYIYLKLDPKSSIARAKLLKRHSTKYAWFTHPNLGIKAYDFFFKFLEPDVPRIIVNGNISTEEQVNIINQEFVKYEFIK